MLRHIPLACSIVCYLVALLCLRYDQFAPGMVNLSAAGLNFLFWYSRGEP